MDRRRDRVFLAGIAASLLVHGAAVSVIAVRAASHDPAARQIEFLPVEFTREVSPVEVQRPQTTPPPPEPQPVAETRPEPARTLRETRLPDSHRDSRMRTVPPLRQLASAGRAGAGTNPRPGGGELNTGTPSTGGDLDLGPGGRSRPGWVPGRGSGEGSGTGPGRGEPEPVVTPGPAAPVAPAPAPPPAPREVRVTVCQASGLLPGRYCQNTVTRTFHEADVPTRVCTLCRPPEPPPEHRSTQAEVVKARFLSGSNPSIPPSVRLSRPVSVTCQYTVGTDGGVKDVTIVDSSGHRALDQEVLKAVRSYRYNPATQGGIPREVTMRRTFTFQPTD